MYVVECNKWLFGVPLALMQILTRGLETSSFWSTFWLVARLGVGRSCVERRPLNIRISSLILILLLIQASLFLTVYDCNSLVIALTSTWSDSWCWFVSDYWLLRPVRTLYGDFYDSCSGTWTAPVYNSSSYSLYSPFFTQRASYQYDELRVLFLRPRYVHVWL